MVDRFELVGFGIHESRASIRLECSVATGYKWIEPGNRTVQVTDVIAPENDLEAGVRSRFAPEAPESDIQRAIGAVLALRIVGTEASSARWASFEDFLVWLDSTRAAMSADAGEARGRVYDEHSQNLGNGGIRGCNPHDVPNRRCEARAWETLAGEILADAKILAAELDRAVRRG